MSQTVGMIGLGIMGMPMSANMLKTGLKVIGYGGPRSNAEKTAALEAMGGKGASSPREVAEQAGVVITVLPSVASLEDVIHGKDGLLSSGRSGLILVEAGTFPIEDKVKARDALQQAGMVTLDAPLSGTGAQAVRKDVAVYASGDREAYERCVPVFMGFAKSSYYLGEFGNGSRMKYVANLLVSIHNVSTAEAFVLGMKSGLDPETILKVISDGAGDVPHVRGAGPHDGERGIRSGHDEGRDLAEGHEDHRRLRKGHPLPDAPALRRGPALHGRHGPGPGQAGHGLGLRRAGGVGPVREGEEIDQEAGPPHGITPGRDRPYPP